MAKLQLKKGTTSKIVHVFIQDSSVSTGAGLTGLTNASGSLVAYYMRPGDASPTAITLASGTLGTWSSGGFKEVSSANMPGVYELGIPDAALATGANQVVIMLKGAANMAPMVLEIELTAVDNQSANAFITGVNSIAPPSNWNLMSVDASGRVDVIKIAGTTQTARDLGGTLGVAGAGLTALGDTRIANLDATISSRAAATALATLQGNVTTILADYARRTGDYATAAALSTLQGNVTTILADYARRTGDYATVAALATLQGNVTSILADYARRTGDYSTLAEAGIRTAVGLASANLDTQLAAIAGFIDTEIAAILAAVDTEVGAIKIKTDNLPADTAAVLALLATQAKLLSYVKSLARKDFAEDADIGGTYDAATDSLEATSEGVEALTPGAAIVMNAEITENP